MAGRIVTIDGPAGAGKTTVSRALSEKLGCVYVDTGALYRGVAYEINRQGIDWENSDILDSFLSSLKLDFVLNEDQQLVLTSHGRDISGFIRTSEISMLASKTSALPSVRAALLNIQRQIAESQDTVFEGRDMGTVVFPKASFKFFLVADLSVRAKRRYDEMDESHKNIETVQEEMQTRDQNDSTRKLAPLKPADDAILIDSSNLSVDQVVEKIIGIIEKA